MGVDRIRTDSPDEGRVLTQETLKRLKRLDHLADNPTILHPFQKEALRMFGPLVKFPWRVPTIDGVVVITEEPPLFGLPGRRIKSPTGERFVWSRDFIPERIRSNEAPACWMFEEEFEEDQDANAR